jgi:hypothetical protein
MQQTTQLRINWLNVNVPTVLAVLAAAVSIITYFDDMNDRLTSIEQYRESRGRVTDGNFAEIREQLKPLINTPQEIVGLKAADVVMNARLDRLADTIIETLRKDISQVSVKVEVLTTKHDSTAAKVEELGQKLDQLSPTRLHRAISMQPSFPSGRIRSRPP